MRAPTYIITAVIDHVGDTYRIDPTATQSNAYSSEPTCGHYVAQQAVVTSPLQQREQENNTAVMN